MELNVVLDAANTFDPVHHLGNWRTDSTDVSPTPDEFDAPPLCGKLWWSPVLWWDHYSCIRSDIYKCFTQDANLESLDTMSWNRFEYRVGSQNIRSPCYTHIQTPRRWVPWLMFGVAANTIIVFVLRAAVFFVPVPSASYHWSRLFLGDFNKTPGSTCLSLAIANIPD